MEPISPSAVRFLDIRLQDLHEFDYEISEVVYSKFLDAFQDLNPLHVDQVFAQEKGFLGKVMHGAILNGFVSHFVGVVFPGKDSLLLSVDMRYLNPSYLGDKIRLSATVSQLVESQKVVVLSFKIWNFQQQQFVANARVQVAVRSEVEALNEG